MSYINLFFIVIAAQANNKIFVGIDISGSFYEFAPLALQSIVEKKILAKEIKGKRNVFLSLVRIDDNTNLDDILLVCDYKNFNSYLQEVLKTKQFLQSAQKLLVKNQPSNRTDFLGFFNVVSNATSSDDNLTLIILTDGIHNTATKFPFEKLKRISGIKRVLYITNGAQYIHDRWKAQLTEAGFVIEIYTLEMLNFNK